MMPMKRAETFAGVNPWLSNPATIYEKGITIAPHNGILCRGIFFNFEG